MPTGLSIGRTLPIFDVVGRNREGQRILAQCKKDLYPKLPDEEFTTAVRISGDDEQFFYFAYGGCLGECSARVRVISRDDVEHWFVNSKNGRSYLSFLRS